LLCPPFFFPSFPIFFLFCAKQLLDGSLKVKGALQIEKSQFEFQKARIQRAIKLTKEPQKTKWGWEEGKNARGKLQEACELFLKNQGQSDL
jgi:ribosomal protein L24E